MNSQDVQENVTFGPALEQGDLLLLSRELPASVVGCRIVDQPGVSAINIFLTAESIRNDETPGIPMKFMLGSDVPAWVSAAKSFKRITDGGLFASKGFVWVVRPMEELMATFSSGDIHPGNFTIFKHRA